MSQKSTSILKNYFKKSFFQLIYHVTFKCNSRCKFCFNWKELNKNGKEELSLEEINKISCSMPDFYWLLFSGGEPMLRNDLEQVAGIFYKNNKVKHLTLPTNGLLPKRIFEVVRHLLSEYKNLTVTVSFSLDSFKDVHDELRGIPGCFDKLMESYDALQSLRKNKNLNLKFNTVVGNFNYNNLENIIKKIREFKPDMHTADFIRGDASLSLSNLKFKDLGLPPKDKIDEIIGLIKDNFDYYRGYSNLKNHSKIMTQVSKIIQKEYLSLFKKIITEKRQVIPCLAYRTSLALYPYGDVSFCEPIAPFANFRDFGHDYKKIIISDSAKKQTEIIKNKKCACYHPCFQYLNILLSPKLMTKGFLKNVF